MNLYSLCKEFAEEQHKTDLRDLADKLYDELRRNSFLTVNNREVDEEGIPVNLIQYWRAEQVAKDLIPSPENGEFSKNLYYFLYKRFEARNMYMETERKWALERLKPAVLAQISKIDSPLIRANLKTHFDRLFIHCENRGGE